MILNFCSKLWAKTVLCAQFRSTGGVWCSAWGVSPTVSTSKTGKVTTIEITDAQGTHTATVNDGESVEVVQSTGTSEVAVMSQKAVTDIIGNVEQLLKAI